DRLQIESRTIPLLAGELDVQPAVHGFTSDLAADIVERDAAVYGAGVHAAAHVFNDDAAVGRVDAQVGLAWDLQLVGNGPMTVIVPAISTTSLALGAVSANAPAGGGDFDFLGQLLRVVTAVVVDRDARAHMGFRSIPASDGHAAVASGIEGDGVRIRDRLFAHLAEVRAPLFAAPVVL